jgi:chromosome segregation ATPase
VSQEKDMFRELTAKLSALNPDVDRHTKLLRQEEAQLARLLEKKEMLQNDLNSLLESEEGVTLELEEVQVAIEGLSIQKAEFDEKLQNIIQLVSEAREEESLSNRVYNQALADLKDFEKTLEANKGRRAALEQERDSSSNRKERLSQEIEMLSIELSQVEMSIQELISERELREQEHDQEDLLRFARYRQ